MKTDAAIFDLSGRLVYWGPISERARGLSMRPRQRAGSRDCEDVPFGDLQGPLAYWGPAVATTQPAAVRLVAA